MSEGAILETREERLNKGTFAPEDIEAVKERFRLDSTLIEYVKRQIGVPVEPNPDSFDIEALKRFDEHQFLEYGKADQEKNLFVKTLVHDRAPELMQAIFNQNLANFKWQTSLNVATGTSSLAFFLNFARKRKPLALIA